MAKNKMAGVDSEAEREVFARNFRAARLKLRLRQSDICRLTGIAQSHISEIEAAQSNLALDTMVKLAVVVKAPLWRLFKPGEFVEEEAPVMNPLSLPRRPRSNTVDVEFSSLHLRRLKKAASDAGLSVPEFIRKVLCETGVLPN